MFNPNKTKRKETPPMEKVIMKLGKSSRATYDVLEEMVRLNVQEFIQDILEDKITEFLGRGKSEQNPPITDGIALSSGNIVGWMDCDFSMPPDILPLLVESLDDYDIAIRSRYVEGEKDNRSTILGIIKQ